nr:MAG TPA: hypothetical protein [Bacteriophage sp.]
MIGPIGSYVVAIAAFFFNFVHSVITLFEIATFCKI